MSKFCSNCGTQLDDAAVVCGNCGASVGKPSGVAGVLPANLNTDKIKKIAIPVCAGVLALIVLIIAISAISSHSGYRGIVNKVITYGYKNQKYEKFPKFTSKMVLDYYEDIAGNSDEDAEEMISDIYETVFDSCSDYFEEELETSKYGIKYKVEKVKDLNKTKRESKLYKYLDEDEYDNYEKMKEIKVNVTAKKGSRDEDVDLYIYIVKEKGGWKLLDVSYAK